MWPSASSLPSPRLGFSICNMGIVINTCWFHHITHSTDIYWVPPMYQTMSQIWVYKGEWNRHTSRPHGTYGLLGEIIHRQKHLVRCLACNSFQLTRNVVLEIWYHSIRINSFFIDPFPVSGALQMIFYLPSSFLSNSHGFLSHFIHSCTQMSPPQRGHS